MKRSEDIAAFAEAMSKAQSQMRPAEFDGTNPHFKSKYVTLASVWNSIQKPLTDNGFSIYQDVTNSERGISVITLLVHKSGQWMEFSPLEMPVSKQDAQGFGSSISYAKRYALCSNLCIVGDEDDDGNAACDKSTGEVKKPETKPGMASEAQKNFIKSLIKKHTKESNDILKNNNVLSMDDLTLEKAKQVIDDFQSLERQHAKTT